MLVLVLLLLLVCMMLLLLLLLLKLLLLRADSTCRTCRRLRRLFPGMKPFSNGGVGQRGRRLGRQLVALRSQHGQRGSTQARVILQRTQEEIGQFKS